MLRFERIDELRNELRSRRKNGERIGFVPTMGALHEGHLSLIRECSQQAKTVVVSIFVNPLQFGPKEDFARYPREPEVDASRAASAGATICFLPSVQEMYPTAQTIQVRAGEMGSRWEGEVRPGHFDGVLTVVAKLFNIVVADIALFGQKDFQQAVLVRTMVRELRFPTAIVIAPTVRDRDGLALSSRNAYLSPEERANASAIPRSLVALLRVWQSGESKSAALSAIAMGVLEKGGVGAPQYLAIVDPNTLVPVDVARKGTVVLLAARVGSTRLIDNVVLDKAMPTGLDLQ